MHGFEVHSTKYVKILLVMEVLIWSIIFVAALVLLVKGADWLLESAERIGLAAGLSSFVVGVVIVGLGTSFPEIVSSIAAVIKGVTEIVAANAIGSNIANILLVVGLSAIVGGRLVVTKDLIDLELPLLAGSTLLFLFVVLDGTVAFGESVLLVILFFVYLTYTIFYSNGTGETDEETLPSRAERREEEALAGSDAGKIKLSWRDGLWLALGIIALSVGAKYLIDSVVELSTILNIGVGVISLAAVALGTSLPELLVSVKASLVNKSEVALGTIFGSNVFNILLVVGVPGLFARLSLDEATLTLGLPIMIVATFIFIISGISRRVHAYEGAMYLVLYFFFIGKLFGLI